MIKVICNLISIITVVRGAPAASRFTTFVTVVKIFWQANPSPASPQWPLCIIQCSMVQFCFVSRFPYCMITYYKEDKLITDHFLHLAFLSNKLKNKKKKAEEVKAVKAEGDNYVGELVISDSKIIFNIINLDV